MKIKLAAWQKIFFFLVGFWIVELASFSFFHGTINQTYVYWVLLIATGLVAIYKLEYGLLLVLGELFFGSMGHLFHWDLSFARLSLRVGLFSVLMLVFSGHLLKETISRGWSNSYFRSLTVIKKQPSLIILALFLILALGQGWWRGYDGAIIFSDFNAWLYWLLLWPVLVVYEQKPADSLTRLRLLFIAAAIWLSIKTLFLLFVFSHNLDSAAPLYYWLRGTLGGEVTALTDSWPRIFIQGQVYVACAFLLVFWQRNFSRPFRQFWQATDWTYLGLAALFLSVILASLSRSFWVAMAGALLISLLLRWRLESLQSAARASLWLAATMLLSLVIIYTSINFPYQSSQTISLGSTFLDRVSAEDEPALASRWSLLPVLVGAIKENPWLGQGFGATVSYFSSDPRVLSRHPDGYYTTYAFEWAYLDTWLKIGLLGLAAYLWFLWSLIVATFYRFQAEQNKFFIGLAACLCFLLLTNIFTPYLNHPLGIGFLLLMFVLVSYQKTEI